LFKAIKQNLKIKTFVGTSANAVKTQVWTALIAMLLAGLYKLSAPDRAAAEVSIPIHPAID